MKKLTKMFSGKPNFSLRNKKLTRRRSISGATSNATFGTSQSGQFTGANNPKSKTLAVLKGGKTLEENLFDISRPSSVSSLGPQQITQTTQAISPIKLNGNFSLKVDVSFFKSSPDSTPNINDIRSKPEIFLFGVTGVTTCDQLLPKVIDRVIQMNPSNAKRDPNLFYIASVDINNDSRELRNDVTPLNIIQKSNGLISHFKLLARQGTVIKVYSNNILPGCEYKTLSVDIRTTINKVTELILRAMRMNEPIENFALQAFSPSIGMASRRIPLAQDDLALAALKECGYDFSFVLVREQAPGSEPIRRARLSKSRARLSNEHARLLDSPSSNETDLETGTFDNILIDGPTLSHLQPTDSIISLSGLSFVSVDSNTDSSANSAEIRSNSSVFMDNTVLNIGKNVVSRSYSSPLIEQKSVLYPKPNQINIAYNVEKIDALSSSTNPPSSPDDYHTPESNVSPVASNQFIDQLNPVQSSPQKSSPLFFIKFPPPPPFEPGQLNNEELGHDNGNDVTLTSQYNRVVSPTDQDSGISSPHPPTIPSPQEDESRGSYPSDTSLTSTGTTPSLHYQPGAPGSLIYDLTNVSDLSLNSQSGRIGTLSLFTIIRDCSVFTVEVTNTGQGLGISLYESEAGLIVIQELMQGGVVQTEGSIQPGDQLIEVNNRLVIGSSRTTVASIVKGCIGPIKLVIARENKLKSSMSADAIVSSSGDNSEEEIERLNRALKASRPVLSRLKQKNGVLMQQVENMRQRDKKQTEEQNIVIKKLESYENESAALSVAIKGLSQTGKFPLRNPIEMEPLETIRSEISRFCEEVHTKLTTAKDKLKLAINQASNYRRQNEKLTKDLKTLQTEFETEKATFAKNKDRLEQIQSSTCIDCKVKDKEIAKLRTSKEQPSSPDSTPTTNCGFGMCTECANKEKLLEQLDNELTDKMLLIADQEAKLHLLRSRK